MNARLQTKTRKTWATPPSVVPVSTSLRQRKLGDRSDQTKGNDDAIGRAKHVAFRPASVSPHDVAMEGEREMPPVVEEVLRSPGEPLDTFTRAFMESGFGHDFSQVRVHTDTRAAESARAVDALAYTVGQDVVFGAGQYRSQNSDGRLLIAHELAHTIQQRNVDSGRGGEDAGLERAADHAAVAALFHLPVEVSPASAPPPIQFLKVTQGALGKALEVFTNKENVPSKAITLLQQSKTFMQVANVIDRNYVWRGDSWKVSPVGETGPDGRLKEGPFIGRRELFDVLPGKPSFEPFEAPPEPGKGKVSGDVIHLESTDPPGFIQELAHEATHAARFVGASGPPPTTIVAEVNAGILDEVETRKSEAKVLSEIPSKDVKARGATVGSRVPAEVERDISPAFGLTYLEHFFFASRLREAQTADGLTNDEADAMRANLEKQLEANPSQKAIMIFKPRPEPSGIYDLSQYGETWFKRRVAQLEWEQFHQQNKPSNPDFAADKEKLLQDHASRFFEGRVSYQPLPPPQATP